MRDTTLCFLIDGDNVCLAMKKHGFGEGKWNGVGGKVKESVQAARTLEKAGYTNVAHYKDGLAGWQSAGYEFE